MTGEKTQYDNIETILRPGQVVAGRYCVDHLISKGGMAAVWAGTNQRTGKRVALKVILRSFASTPDANELFRREALAASRVNHPNVVNVFDVVDHEGMPCIVMELLDGEPLSIYLARKGFLAIEEAVALLLPAMRGVAAANAQGVVHRDLKPQNIFICIGPDGRLLTTKVLDFGISVVVEKTTDANPGTVVLTTHGTPAYMSPEHITAAPDIDERADVYGFGVLFFEALTGKLPFVGDPSPALLVRILNETAPKVSLFRPDLLPAMETIIERAMAKNPDDRFSTLNEFICALEEECLPPSPLPRALTPMVGVPLFEHPSGGSGLADAAFRVVHRPEGAEGRKPNETQALFALSVAKGPTDGESSRRFVPPGRAAELLPATPAAGRASSMRSRKDRARRVLASGAAFLGALLLVAWMATPGRRDSPRQEVAPSTPTPLAASPTVVIEAQSTTPLPKAQELSLPETPLAAATEPTATVPRLVAPARVAPLAARPATPRSAIRPSAIRTHGQGKLEAQNELTLPLARPEQPSTIASSPKPPASRAGSLSPDDF